MVSPVSGSSSVNYQNPVHSPEEDAAVMESVVSFGKGLFSQNQARADQAQKDLTKEPEKDEDDPDSQPV